jgi:hypothetical protein
MLKGINMSRLLLSGICVIPLVLCSQAFAYGGSSADGWSVGVDYNNMNVDTSNSDLAHITAPSNLTTTGNQMGATSKFQSALLDVTYKSFSGFWLRAFGGMAFNGEIDAGGYNYYGSGGTGQTVDETWTFTHAPTYGAQIGYDIFPDARIHLAPSLRWQQTKFTGTAGSVYNSSTNTSFTYGSGNPTQQMTTLGGTPLLTNDGGTIATSFNESIFNAQMALAFDILSDGINTFTLGGGAEEAMVVLNGSVVHNFAGGAVVEEDYNLSSNTQLGYFAMMNLTLGPITVAGEAHFTAEKFYLGRLAVNF